MSAAARRRPPPSAIVEIAIAAPAWRQVPQVEPLVARCVDAALAANPAAAGEISISLMDDAAIRALNAAYRGKDYATNVLSFPPPPALPGGPVLLGDIAVAYETTEREAAAEGKTITDHLAHLIVHGVLHLLGHDHETDAEASAMEAMERSVLAGLGIADPYADHAAE